MIRNVFPGALAAIALAAGLLPLATQAETLVVYSARNEQLIKPVFDAYTRETGIEVKFATGDAAVLIERLAAEGRNSPADLLMTVDAGELWNAAERGLLRPIDSQVLAAQHPGPPARPGRRWFGLSLRARTIVFNPQRVDPAQLSTYEALAGPAWKGRLCLRTSKKVYNQSLVAMMIAEHGEPKTEQIVRGWVANLATDAVRQRHRSCSRRSPPGSATSASSTPTTSAASSRTSPISRCGRSGPTRARAARTSTSRAPA